MGMANMTESETMGSTLGQKSLGPLNKNYFKLFFLSTYDKK